jgi:hypothetical protein
VVGDLPHGAIRRALALFPVLLTGAMLLGQAFALLAPAGPRDAHGIVKGHDFVHFYTLGVVARSGQLATLYETRPLNETMWRVVPEARPGLFLPLYGPQVAVAFAPLAAMPYERAVHVWLVVSLLLYGAAVVGIVWLVPASAVPRAAVALTLVLNPALAALVTSGQTSAVALMAFVIAWFAFDQQRPWAAGIALGLLWYKPTLAAGVVAMLLVAGEWRVLGGFAVAAILQLALGWTWAGTPVVLAYLRTLASFVAEGGIPASQPEHLHSLLGFWRLLLGRGMVSAVLWIVSAGLVLSYARRAWRLAAGDRSVQIALLCLVAVLLAPHLYVYDLVLLAPALVILWTWSDRRPELPGLRTLQWLVGLAAVAPLSDAVAATTSVQLSTCVLTALVLQFARVLSASQASPGAMPSE